MSQSQAKVPTQKKQWSALLLTGLFAGLISSIAFRYEGSLAQQRVIVDLLMPVGFAWLVSFYATIRFWQRQQRLSSVYCAGIFLAISVLFNPALMRTWMSYVEGPVPLVSPLDSEAPVYRTIVVLGGGVSLGRDGLPQLNGDGMRVATAAQMWHAHKAVTIICTGADNYIPGPAPTDPAELAKRDLWNPAGAGIELLVSLGAPRDQLFRIGGINTSAEMKELKSFLQTPPANFPKAGQVGLITSAYHMPRAMRLAKGEGLDLHPIPVAYQTGPAEPISINDFVPNVGAGKQFYIAMRECLARLVGR